MIGLATAIERHQQGPDCRAQLPALLSKLNDLAKEEALVSICRAYTIDSQTLSALVQDEAALPASLANAVLKRQVEFAAGRWCASQALRQLGYIGPTAIGIGAHRSPIWPVGYLGSISHSNGWALAVAAKRTDFCAIGIDLEAILPDASARSVSSHIACASELALGKTHGLALAAWISLLFSAKESLFKALYPTVGRYFHFHDAHAEHLDLSHSTLSLRLNNHLSDQHPAGQRYTIRFAFDQQNFLTRCLVPA